jgi:CRP/FNR family transcriptional regulator, cyclic AMP receptor protein
VDLLSSLREADREDLRCLAVSRRYRAGTAIFCEGEPSDNVVIIEDGRAKVTSVGVDGRDVVLTVVGQGEIVGELAGLDGGLRSATLTTLEPATVLLVRGDGFASYLATHPAVATVLLRVLAQRLRQADQRAIEFATLDVSGRLCRRLAELVEAWGEPVDGGAVELRLPLTHDDLAAWTASSREAVTKALAGLRERGLVETHRRRIVVVDLPAIRRRGLLLR